MKKSWVYGVELKPDFSGVIGEPVLALRPPVSLSDKQAEWESRSVTAREVNRRWTEGSVTFKKGDTYYIMYSANHFGGQYYAVGYATAKSPLGPYKKAANNPILQKNTDRGGSVTGTGHNSITYSPDGSEMFCIYHARTAKTGNERVVCIDRMTVKKRHYNDSGANHHAPKTAIGRSKDSSCEMKICLAQTRPISGDVQQNIDRHCEWIEQAVDESADAIFFSELSLTGYEPMLATELATTQYDTRFTIFQQLSNANQLIIGVGMPIRHDAGVQIGMLVFQPGRVPQTYAKQFIYPDEEPFFSCGNELIILTVGSYKIALAICYELSVPIHAETAHRNGANVYMASVAKSATGVVKAANPAVGRCLVNTA